MPCRVEDSSLAVNKGCVASFARVFRIRRNLVAGIIVSGVCDGTNGVNCIYRKFVKDTVGLGGKI